MRISNDVWVILVLTISLALLMWARSLGWLNLLNRLWWYRRGQAYFLLILLIGVGVAGLLDLLSIRSAPPESLIFAQTQLPTSTPLIIRKVSYLQTRTPTPHPARTPKPASASAASSGCIRWDKVTEDMVGERRCVYGEIWRMFPSETKAQVILFTKDIPSFRIEGKDYAYQEPAIGKCIQSYGTILRSASYYYISIDDPKTKTTDCQR